MKVDGQDIGSRVTATSPPSVAKNQREVLVAGHRAPASARATRPRHLRRLMGARKYVWAFAILGGSSFLVGASTGDVLYAAIPPLIVLAGIVALVWREATRLAARDFFKGFALDHGFNFSEKMALLETTPLLGAGDKRHCENYMEGPLEGVDGVAVGLAHYVFETRAERSDRRNRPIAVYTPHWFTIAVVDLPRAMQTFPGIFLARRGGIFGREDWLERPSLQPVEIESSTLTSRYELLARRNQDRGRLLELFKPTFQTWLADLPVHLFFEYSGGTLVVYATGRLKEGADLQSMLEATSWIARRITEEGEPLRVAPTPVEDLSAPPPTGAAAFPPPPPATKPAVEPSLHAVADAPEPQTVSYVEPSRSVPPPSAH